MKKPTKANSAKASKNPTPKKANVKVTKPSAKIGALLTTFIEAEFALIKQIVKEAGPKGVLWSSIEKEFPHFTLPSSFMTGSYCELHGPKAFFINAPIKHAEHQGVFTLTPLNGGADCLIKLNTPAEAKKIASKKEPLRSGVLKSDGILRVDSTPAHPFK